MFWTQGERAEESGIERERESQHENRSWSVQEKENSVLAFCMLWFLSHRLSSAVHEPLVCETNAVKKGSKHFLVLVSACGWQC